MGNVKKSFLITLFFVGTILAQENEINFSTIPVSKKLDINEDLAQQQTQEEDFDQLEELYKQLDEVEIDVGEQDLGQESVSTAVTLDEDISLVQDEDELLERLSRDPVDLNTVSFVQLRTLPGINSQLAREIIRHRRTKPFKTKSALLTVKGVTPEVYKRVSPYVTVKSVKQLKTDKRIKGQVRFRTKISKPDSAETYLKYYSTSPLRNPIYLYNRTEFSYSSKLDLGYLFLYRPEEPPPTFDMIQKFYLKKWWLKLYSLPYIDKVVVGNYRAGFGYGLVFYENTTETLRPVKPKPRGLREDKSSTYNINLYGLGMETVLGPIETAVVYSKKRYQLSSSKVTSDSYIDEDLLKIKNLDITFSTVSRQGENYEDILLPELDRASLTEELIGFNIVTNIFNMRVGMTFYESMFDKVIDPDKTDNSGYGALVSKYAEYWSSVYRGNHLTVGSIYFDLPMSMLNIYGEYARSNAGGGKDNLGNSILPQDGSGLNLGFIIPYKKVSYYFLYTNLDSTFYSPHGVGFRIYSDADNGQVGVRHGLEYHIDNLNLKFNYATGNIFRNLWSGYSTSESPRYPSKYNEIMFESKYKIKKTELYFRLLDDIREKYIKLSNYNDLLPQENKQVDQINLRRRYQVTYDFTKNLKMRVRYENRWQIYDLPDTNNSAYYGELMFLSMRYKFSNLDLNTGYKIYDADKNIYLSILNPQWYNVYISETENNSAGDKFYFTITSKFAKNVVLWFRYRYKQYFTKSGEDVILSTELSKILNSVDHDFRFQVDINF